MKRECGVRPCHIKANYKHLVPEYPSKQKANCFSLHKFLARKMAHMTDKSFATSKCKMY